MTSQNVLSTTGSAWVPPRVRDLIEVEVVDSGLPANDKPPADASAEWRLAEVREIILHQKPSNSRAQLNLCCDPFYNCPVGRCGRSYLMASSWHACLMRMAWLTRTSWNGSLSTMRAPTGGEEQPKCASREAIHNQVCMPIAHMS